MARVLLIDDNDSYRSVIKSMLSIAGHEVVEAANGDSGLNLFLEHEPEIVITDILMPECDGIEFLHSLSTISHSTPIICISGGIEGDTTWMDPLIKSFGAVHFLKKPFEKEVLLSTVQSIIPA